MMGVPVGPRRVPYGLVKIFARLISLAYSARESSSASSALSAPCPFASSVSCCSASAIESTTRTCAEGEGKGRGRGGGSSSGQQGQQQGRGLQGQRAARAYLGELVDLLLELAVEGVGALGEGEAHVVLLVQPLELGLEAALVREPRRRERVDALLRRVHPRRERERAERRAAGVQQLGDQLLEDADAAGAPRELLLVGREHLELRLHLARRLDQLLIAHLLARLTHARREVAHPAHRRRLEHHRALGHRRRARQLGRAALGRRLRDVGGGGGGLRHR